MSPAAGRARRERTSELARAAAAEVVDRLYLIADQLDDVGADLRAEVERRQKDRDRDE